MDGKSLMGVEVAITALSELLVLICSSHKITLILKGTRMTDLLIHKSGRKKKSQEA